MKFVSVFILVLLSGAFVESSYAAPRARMVVQATAQVVGETITLGDIAQFSKPNVETEHMLETLKAIELGKAPMPKAQLNIPGVKILDEIRKAGVNLDEIGYSVPKAVTVSRNGRVIRSEELLAAVRKSLELEKTEDLQVREVRLSHAHVIPVGDTAIEIEKLGEPSAGKLPLRVAVSVNEIPQARFLATAIVDYWKEVPVLNKTLDRGMLVTQNDIELVRLNLIQQPIDVADSAKQVLGHRVKSRIPAGNTIAKTLIERPPVVEQGRKVIIVYRRGSLSATATGIALDSGMENDSIRIRNDNSKKVIKATIVNENEVVVGN
jgi:flagella basal body P-ring formation protein FlgA